MKQILIVGSGEDYNIDKVRAIGGNSNYIIASDGGYDTIIRAGLIPDIVIGDFDSISPDTKIADKIKIERHPAEKDLSDSELCLQYALSLKPEKIVMCAVTGSYIDHSLANILNIFRNSSSFTEVAIITSNSTICGYENGEHIIKGLTGRRVSIFFPEPVSGVELEGFKYSFGSKTPGVFEYSLSNVIEKDIAKIKLDTGKFILFIFDGGYE